MHSRKFRCKHCNMLYRPKRSDQKFCSTSHRAANHQYNKRQNQQTSVIKQESTTPSLEQAKGIPKPVSNANPILPFAEIVIVNLVNQAVQKLAGIHNHDVMNGIKEILDDTSELLKGFSNIEQYLRANNRINLEKEEWNNLWVLNVG